MRPQVKAGKIRGHAVNEALGLKDHELIAYFALFAAIGFETSPGTLEALAQRNKAETAKWAKAIQDAKKEAE